MQATFFQAVASILTAGNNAIIEVQGLGDGQIKVVYTPNLGPTPQNASVEEVNLRAAIAKPLVVAGPADEVEADLMGHLKSKAAVVSRGLSMLDEIERLGAAALATAKAGAAKAAPVAAVGDNDEEEDELDEGDAPAATPVVADGANAAAEPAIKSIAHF
jgi:PRTRC genetic system protein E